MDDYGVPLGEKERAFRDEVRALLDHNIADLADRQVRSSLDGMREWQRRLHDAGLAAVGWPAEFGGRSASPVEQLVYNTEMGRAGAPASSSRPVRAPPRSRRSGCASRHSAAARASA